MFSIHNKFDVTRTLEKLLLYAISDTKNPEYLNLDYCNKLEV